jgi:hypothetical protein
VEIAAAKAREQEEEVAMLEAELGQLRAKVSALGACVSLTRLRSIRLLLLPSGLLSSMGFARVLELI